MHLAKRITGRELLDGPSEDDLVARIDAESEARRQLALIKRLSAGEREVAELHLVDGLELAEEAGLIGIRAGAARVRLHRARQHLATLSSQEACHV